MCGIAGIVGRLPEQKAKSILQVMLQVQRHRGPDDEGMTTLDLGGAIAGLGNRRLAILDLSSLGHQPMLNPDTGDILVHNGEIYNFLELRQELVATGYSFRGHSDTEVLLRAYERWGTDFLDRLRGMFAFALWDARRRELLLARDHLGIKPLYYASLPGTGFGFASEVRAFLISKLLPRSVDQRALAGYLAYGAVQEPLTIIEGITALPPASWVRVNDQGEIIAQRPYWQLPQPDPGTPSLHELIEKGRSLLEQAVRRHLLSDVPVGVFLSSGLDSTAMVGLARRVAGEQVHAFTVAFPDIPNSDEGPLASRAAKRLDVVYHECRVDKQTALGWVRDALDGMDQPTMDGVNTYMVSRAVRERGIVVALSGQGGDEVFGGYSSFRAVPRWYRHLRWLRSLPPYSRAALVGLATRRQNTTRREKARDIARTGADLLPLYFQYRRLLSDSDLSAFGLHASALGLTPSFHWPAAGEHRYLVCGDPVASVRRLETAFYLGNTLLRDGDVFGMANSLEIRVPFLDRDFVDWAFRLPGRVLLPKRSPGKFLLRRICADLYTPDDLARPKRGFTPPFNVWLRGPLRPLTEENLASLKRSGLLSANALDGVQRAFLRAPDSAAWSRLWILVALGHWLGRRHAETLAVST
jgi:asparagine synthase (glutamine-hydrolysing)